MCQNCKLYAHIDETNYIKITITSYTPQLIIISKMMDNNYTKR